jgi:hypothetical protein
LKVEGSFDEQQEAKGRTQQENKTIPSGNAHLSKHNQQPQQTGAYIQCSATITSNMIMRTCKHMLEILVFREDREVGE